MSELRYEWYEKAACKDQGADIFYADFSEQGSSGKKKTGDAKKMCRRCEVVAECLTFAFNNDERYGVWGSLSTRERLSLKRNLQIDKMTTEIASSILLEPAGKIKNNFKHIVFIKEKI